MKSLNEVSRTPPRGGVRKKKWGANRKGGARTPRTPPVYAPEFNTTLLNDSLI